MTTDERKTLIVQALRENQRVHADELAARFGVSEDTIRRDLRALADAGLVRRVHGGAIPHTPSSVTYHARVGQSVLAKGAIVEAALKLVRPGQLILLDDGTTATALAASLPDDIALTIVTHSLTGAMALLDKPKIELIVLGGRVSRDAAAMLGADAVAGYGRCRADLCFIGVASVDASIGLGVFKHEDAEVKRAMMNAAAEVVVLTSAEKLGTSAPFVVGPLADVDHLITESAAPAEQVRLLREAVRRVTTA